MNAAWGPSPVSSTAVSSKEEGHMDLRGASALVTGGASGLGAATVRALCAAGATAVIADVNRKVGEELAQELNEKAQFAETDVTREEPVRKAVSAAAEKRGGLRVLVKFAGGAFAANGLRKYGLRPFAIF